MITTWLGTRQFQRQEAAVCGPDGVAVFDALNRHRRVREAMLQAFDLLELGTPGLPPAVARRAQGVLGAAPGSRDSALRGIFSFMATGRLNEPIEPMDLANMRQNGVRSLAVRCHQCHHEKIINADHWPGDLTVTSFIPRMVCTKCGTIGADVRPNWRE
jgi:hypothetical protein